MKVEAGPVVFSDEQPVPLYRYVLKRHWDETRPVVNFIMLNPSTADATQLDTTLRRCLGYSIAWGYGGFVITNLFAYRSKDRMILRAVQEPVGRDNDKHLIEQAKEAGLVVCGWGPDGRLGNRSEVVKAMLQDAGIVLHYLKLVGPGKRFPGHPLYLPSELVPLPWL